MKKNIVIIFSLLLFAFFSLFINAQEFDLDIGAAILIDAETGQVIYEKNADKQLPPASITKIMTLLVAMEQIEKGEMSLKDEVTISKLADSMGGSQIFLKAGTRVKLADLLKAVTIASGNDASVAVAEATAGTYGNFVSWMNDRADSLGMENTHFENTTGLPTESGKHYSSARDMATMARELVKHPQILEWASIWHEMLQLPTRKAVLTNTNKLIRSYPGMDGLKTGHTQEAGFCLAATAARNNMRLISVVLNAETEKEREEVTARLLDYGFNAFNKELIISKGDEVQNIEVPNGKKTVTTAQAAEDLYVVVKRGTKDTITKKISIMEKLKAPIKKGKVIGEELIVQEGKVLAKVDLLAVEDIEKAGLLTRIWRSFVNWVGGLIEGLLG